MDFQQYVDDYNIAMKKALGNIQTKQIVPVYLHIVIATEGQTDIDPSAQDKRET